MAWRKIDSCIFGSRKWNGLPDDFCRLLYVLLIVNADPWGIEQGDAARIKATCCPLLSHIGIDDVEAALVALDASGLIQVYDAVGRRFYHVTRWDDFQRIDDTRRGRRSQFPAPHNCSGIGTDRSYQELSVPTQEQLGTNRSDIGTDRKIQVSRSGEDQEKISKRQEKINTYLTLAGDVYEFFRLKVRSGAKTDSIKSISRLISNEGYSVDDLKRFVENYVDSDNFRDEQEFRIQANNFFGRSRRFEEFKNVGGGGGGGRDCRPARPDDGMTASERILSNPKYRAEMGWDPLPPPRKPKPEKQEPTVTETGSGSDDDDGPDWGDQ